MARLIAFLGAVLAAGLAFAWLADRPGDLVVTFSGMRYELALTTALAVFLAGAALVMAAWWLLRSVIDGPQSLRRHFRARKRDRGYQALSTGLIAAGAGDAVSARKLNARAAGLLPADQEPLIRYLDAQVALLEGDGVAARRAFEAMVEDGETRALGLRGLYLEAQRAGDVDAARLCAQKALEAAPTLDWAVDAAIAGHAADGSWDKALAVIEARRRVAGTDKAAANRARAVLLTAKAMGLVEADINAARAAALEAVKLAPGFAPAAISAARVLFKNDELRKGMKILETAWKAAPHPGIADAYVHARSGDAAAERLRRAETLENLRPGEPDALLAVGGEHLAAGNFKAARRAVEAVLKARPTERAWLLLADIEDAETGLEGRVREWLQKALKAPRDATWVADGQTSERWLPVSPVSGRLDAFEWKTPAMLLAGEAAAVDAETLGRVIEAPERPEPPRASAVAPAREIEAKAPDAAAPPMAPAVRSAESEEPADAEKALRTLGYDDAAAPAKAKSRFRLF
jgi:HemY protein